MIGNDAPAPEGRLASLSVRLLDYLSAPETYRAQMVHVGIEGWTEAARRAFAKPISDEDVQRFVVQAGRAKQQAEVFMIAGYPGWAPSDIDRFVDNLPVDAMLRPELRMKVTYFDPCPHTPLADVPITGAFVAPSEVFAKLGAHSRRWRTYPMASSGRTAWRACLHRCLPDEAPTLGPEPRDTNVPGSFDAFAARLRGVGLEGLLTRTGACANIHTSILARAADMESAVQAAQSIPGVIVERLEPCR